MFSTIQWNSSFI